MHGLFFISFMLVCICTYKYIYKYNLPSQYNVIKMENMPTIGNLDNYPEILKSWFLKKNLQPPLY